ncbi:MAG: hypothetical protein ACTIJG_06650, partial [Staphylococcus saprophyticus]
QYEENKLRSSSLGLQVPFHLHKNHYLNKLRSSGLGLQVPFHLHKNHYLNKLRSGSKKKFIYKINLAHT